MRTIDLNASRAARAEKDQDEPVVIHVGEDSYKLPREMPLAYLETAGEMAAAVGSEDPGEQGRVPELIIKATIALVTEANYRELVDKHALTFDDLREIFQQAGELYGVSLGEVSASPDSSDAVSTP
jgi:hypothetical protein